jgi:hypothetical protein
VLVGAGLAIKEIDCWPWYKSLARSGKGDSPTRRTGALRPLFAGNWVQSH